jgi:uncharacterized protein
MTETSTQVRGSLPLLGYRTPGARIEWLDAIPQLPGRVATDVAGLVGIAERGPLHLAVKTTSWTSYTGIFGGHLEHAYLPDAVEGFFANGGRVCWVVRVADPDTAAAATAELLGEDGAPALQLTAVNEGTWGGRIAFRADRGAGGRFTLILRLPGGIQEAWRNLSMDAGDPRFVAALVNDARAGSRLVRAEVTDGARPPRPASGRLEGGHDGLGTLLPRHFAGSHPPPRQPWGLAALTAVDEVSLVAIPDAWSVPRVAPRARRPRLAPDCTRADRPVEPGGDEPDVAPVELAVRGDEEANELQLALIAHCQELRDRVALLDGPGAGSALRAPTDALEWRRGFDSSYAALYYPWLQVRDPYEPGAVRPVPPCGHVAGICARVDQQVGVHKPPANEVVEGGLDLLALVDDLGHGDLNDAGVNAIRAQPGRQVRVAGARTLARDTEWRFLNVRRLLLMIEESLEEALRWTVFEPNSQALWRDVDRTVRSLLEDLWRRGMLGGATADEAYLVRCDETTNSPSELEAGRLICSIGVLPPPPAEFVIVRLVRTPAGIELQERPGG